MNDETTGLPAAHLGLDDGLTTQDQWVQWAGGCPQDGSGPLPRLGSRVWIPEGTIVETTNRPSGCDAGWVLLTWPEGWRDRWAKIVGLQKTLNLEYLRTFGGREDYNIRSEWREGAYRHAFDTRQHNPDPARIRRVQAALPQGYTIDNVAHIEGDYKSKRGFVALYKGVLYSQKTRGTPWSVW